MKQKIAAATAATLSLIALNAAAATRFEYADVVAATPIYRVVQVSTPQEQCWQEEVAGDRYSRRNQSNTPVLVSTIIGGAIGNAVGHNKSNQRVGAVLGAMLGHSIGRDIVRNRNQPGYVEYETVQRCDTVYEQHEEERLVGYQVTYLFNGEEYSIRTDSDPGNQIRIRVSVQPVL
ncbi:MAG: glycine zipper 2TM domain-containing protein [Gammaproteobacteria bacterium]|nr:glycine zipper 2TM domain-containing protein [Gammaproteobacteria bacterium]MDD9897112.1 glycine zipper 2TM domain-containing protein [Gammaproteobacteria bacterium]MDD9959137.1 glycine zipper 2TM domain-containing protein [Gammaproteobacteria bacterium]